MSSIPQVAEAMKRVLTTCAQEHEREAGFVQRSTAHLDGPGFTQMTVFGWMDNPQASYSQLAHVAASLDVTVSAQAIEQRFGVQSAALLRALLQEAVGEVLCSHAQVPELLSRFNGVYVQDGTIISLPAELKEQWPGCGGSTPQAGQSSRRVQVRLDLAQGGMQGPWLQEGRASERSGEAHEAPLPQGCLYDVDGGYFTLAEMRAHRNAGRFWLTGAKAGMLLVDARGQCWDLVSFLRAQKGEEVDVQVYPGKKERVAARLVAKRVSAQQAQQRRASAQRSIEGPKKGVQRPNARKGRVAGAKRERQRKHRKTGPARLQLLEWTILLTNVPAEKLSVEEVLVLARCRWQIELCWKLWKQVGKLDTGRSAKAYRILTEIYAKLLGLLITHWLTLIQCWQAPHGSLVKACHAMQWMAPALALGVAGVVPLESMIQRTSSSMASGCSVNARRQKPATYQLVNRPELIRGLGSCLLVDRRGLPAPIFEDSSLQEKFVAPCTSDEEAVAGIWSKVLGIEKIGIHDNFFALGGHSLLAMQVISQLRTTLQVELPLRSFFEAPTVAQLTETITRVQASTTKSTMPTLRSISREAHRVPVTRKSNAS